MKCARTRRHKHPQTRTHTRADVPRRTLTRADAHARPHIRTHTNTHTHTHPVCTLNSAGASPCWPTPSTTPAMPSAARPSPAVPPDATGLHTLCAGRRRGRRLAHTHANTYTLKRAGSWVQADCKFGPTDAGPAESAPARALSDVSCRARGRCGQTMPVRFVLRVSPLVG